MPYAGAANSSWAPYAPGEPEPWNVARVVHLHRRMGFGANWGQIQNDLREGPNRAIQRLLAGRIPSPAGDQFETLARTIGDAAVASGNPNRLKAWWIFRMLLSPDPLGERLALMWHNHFATSNRKVNDLIRMREQNELFRRLGRAPFGELLTAVVTQPAMLAWLDADSNRAGHPNENLARELMELFTLGIGNYSEADVKEAARALTGWTISGGAGQFRQQRHDAGEKTILGQAGRNDGPALLAALVEHPATARRLAGRVCGAFMGEHMVDESALDNLAKELHARRLDMNWAVATVIRSRLFFSDANLRSRIVGPVEHAIGVLRALELVDPPPSTLLLSEWTARMGQDLFYPPNVGGWNEGRAWLGSRAIVARANFAAALARGRLWQPARELRLAELVEHRAGTSDLRETVAWFSQLLWGGADPGVIDRATAGAQSSDAYAAALALLLAEPASQLA